MGIINKERQSYIIKKNIRDLYTLCEIENSNFFYYYYESSDSAVHKISNERLILINIKYIYIPNIKHKILLILKRIHEVSSRHECIVNR